MHIETNDGTHQVSIETPDLDPSIEVSLKSGEVLPDREGIFNFNQISAGRSTDQTFILTSDGLVPLTIKEICFVGSNGDCQTSSEIHQGQMQLCSTASSPNECAPIVLSEDPMSAGTTVSFFIRYSPIENGQDTLSAQLLISSDASEEPRYIIQVMATPCTRTVDESLCDLCGNGLIDVGEECDDGNLNNRDECLNHCVAATCGDGLTNPDTEECDDGNQIDRDGCLASCIIARCGDGIVRQDLSAGADEFEYCDDGNQNDHDQCTNLCQVATCGDGILRRDVAEDHEEFEQCDDGNQSDTDACTNACRSTQCGDGILHVGVEECDDGNTLSEDGCSATCLLEVCGNGIIQGTEACDDGNRVDGDQCTNACRSAQCGDGIIHVGVEECDDGNTLANDGCSGDCHEEICGDGIIQGDEACDDRVETQRCNLDCTDSTCGDGVLNVTANEECDDGNRQIESCEGGEISCVVCGSDCTEVSGLITYFCGDGVINGLEQCDDGNTVIEQCDYDVAECTVCGDECTEVNGLAGVFCGDMLVNGLEECDGEEWCADDCTGTAPLHVP